MSASRMPRLFLSENHRRSISVPLYLLDKDLCQWEEWLDKPVAPGLMYQQQDTVSAKQKAELRRCIEGLRKVMVGLRDELHLVPGTPGTAQLILGQATILWEMLAELNSSSLRGYGKVSPELAQYLDPLGESLTQQVQAIIVLFSSQAS